MKRSCAIFTSIALSLVLLAACSSAPTLAPTAAPTLAPTAASTLALIETPTPVPAPEINVLGAHGLTSSEMPTTGGLFMWITNFGTAPDKLLSGKSDACGSVEIHEMVMKADGTMGMNLVTSPLEVPAGGDLEMKKGGFHIMCIQRKPDLFKAGGQISLTLTFEKSGEKTVSAEIQTASMTSQASLVQLGATKEVMCTMGFEVTQDNRLIEYDDVTANPKVVTFAGTIVNKPDLTAAHGLIIIKIDTAGTANAPLNSYAVSHWINYDVMSVGQAYAKDKKWNPLFYTTLEEAQKLTEDSPELNLFCCKIGFPYPQE
jgi:periplasmic copper chaperone A